MAGAPPEASEGIESTESTESTEMIESTGTEAEPSSADDDAPKRSPGRSLSRDDLIEAGETGLLPMLVPGVGPLANPSDCDFDDPFSTCQ